MPRSARATRGLIVLFVAALVLRLAAVFMLHGIHPDGPVTYEHGAIAKNLLAGRGFSIEFLGTFGPTSQQAPLYPFALAGVYALFGGETPEALLTVQVLQAIAGSLVCVLVARLAWLVLPDRPAVGWLAGATAVVFPTHLYAVTHIQVVIWAMLLVTWLWLEALQREPDRQRPLLLGVIAGLCLLVDPILAVMLPIVGVFQLKHWGFRKALVTASVAAMLIAPWIIRNQIVHGEFVFIKDTFGYAFWQGNNAVSWGTDKIPKASAEALRLDHDGTLAGQHQALWNARHETLYIDDVLLKPTGYVEFAGLSEPDRARLLGKRAWAYIGENPLCYAMLCVNRCVYFFGCDETNPKARHPLYQLTTYTWLGLVVIGLALSWPDRDRFWPLYAALAALALFHTLTIVSARFRMPVEPMSFVWVGLTCSVLLNGFCHAWSRLSSRAFVATKRLTS